MKRRPNYQYGMQDRVRRYSFLAMILNGLIDHGQRLDIDETIRHIRSGDVFEWLRATYPDASALQLYGDDDTHTSEMLEQFESLDNADVAHAQRVKNDGLCLLVGFCLEGIQIEAPEEPEDSI